MSHLVETFGRGRMNVHCVPFSDRTWKTIVDVIGSNTVAAACIMKKQIKVSGHESSPQHS
jgi:hypothetical protein